MKISVDVDLLVPVHSVIEVTSIGHEELENVSKNFRKIAKVNTYMYLKNLVYLLPVLTKSSQEW